MHDLDVLRGVALFAVFLVNMTEFAREVMGTSAQFAALPTAALDRVLFVAIEWLLGDKANTIFAFLFGVGFSIQLARAEAKGADFRALYLRRLAVLLAFGTLHLLFVWTWDILHLYALAGFLLFAVRRIPTRTALVLGLALACVAPELVGALWRAAFPATPPTDWLYEPPAILARQHAALTRDYAALLADANDGTWYDYLLNGTLIGWIVYAFGRFLLGLWAGRSGLLQRADAYLPTLCRAARVLLPAGLAAALLVRLLAWGTWRLPGLDADTSELVGDVLRAPAALLLAGGYVAALILARRTARGERLLARFAPVGRMALTNYVTQSAVYGVVLTGWGFGLAGRAGTTVLTGIVVVAFAAQVRFSGWWLARFHYGPLEYAWRALTYGTRPPMRRLTPPTP